MNDYNPLMKDFPMNDLLSATELDRIRIALQQIFNHLRKIRSTKYPMQRALRLVEAISRDLNAQLLKVSSQRSLTLRTHFREYLLNHCVVGSGNSKIDAHSVRRIRESDGSVL